jgi:choline kinase
MTFGLILAAGFGSRLGHDMPKPLIPWDDACIIDHQLGHLKAAGIEDVWVVTGFQSDRVRDHVAPNWPKVKFVDNPMYMDTNTGKSTLIGISQVAAGGVVTLNGDVVFDGDVLPKIIDEPDHTTLAVDPRVCGDEEIKYCIREGRLQALSKQTHGEGEAIGINYIAAEDRQTYETALQYIDMDAYFERAIELMLPFTHKPIRCVTVGNLRAMEVDFPEDLEAARKLFNQAIQGSK